MGAGSNRGFGTSRGSTRIYIPDTKSRLNHIFKNKEGHLEDTPENRKLLEDVANDPSNFLGVDARGNSWSARDLEDGSQVWVRHRDGKIIDGGVDKTPVTWDPETGLCKHDKPVQQKKKKTKRQKKTKNTANQVYNAINNPFLA